MLSDLHHTVDVLLGCVGAKLLYQAKSLLELLLFEAHGATIAEIAASEVRMAVELLRPMSPG